MSKAISVKIKDDLFKEVEEVTKKINIPRNKYINNALSFYNKLEKRKLLKNKLQKELKLIKNSSLEVMEEFEKLDDEILE